MNTMESDKLSDQKSENGQKFVHEHFDNGQYHQNEKISGKILTSSTCHNLNCYNDDQEDGLIKKNKLSKIKSESDLAVKKNKLDKIYLPAEDTMDLEQSYKESTGKKYSSSWFYGDSSKNPYPTIEEQVKLCRKIASQLVDDENRKSKGAHMFYKRLKKSTKWVHEGTKNDTSSTNGSLTADEEVEKLKRNLKMESMPKLKLILDPRELLSLEKLKKTGDIVEHNIVSPDVCHSIVKDLQSPEINRGAAIFLRRKEKSRDWIVDENSTVEQIREKKREQELKKQEENVQKEWLMKKQKEQEQATSLMDTGGHLSNFDVNSGHQKTLYIQAKQPQSLGKLTPKLQNNFSNVNVTSNGQSVKHNLQTNQFLKLNFKNFNRGCRGWGVSNDEYEKQLQKLQDTPEFKSSPIPVNQPIVQSVIQPISNRLNTANQIPIHKSDSTINHPMPAQSASYLPNRSMYHSNKSNLDSQTKFSQAGYVQPLPHSTISTAYQAPRQPHSQSNLINQKPIYQPNKSNLVDNFSKFVPQTRPMTNQNYQQSYYYPNSYSKPQPAQQPIYTSHAHPHHLNHTNSYNTYIFDRQPNGEIVNFATHTRNDHSPNQSSNYSNGLASHLYNGVSSQTNKLVSDNSIKQTNFNLTKLQIPTPNVSIHSFADFNAKPKLFVKC